MRGWYYGGIGLLSALAVVCVAGIFYGESQGTAQDPRGWFLGGAFVGLLLIAYAMIVLLLRRMGIIGPRKAER